MMNFLTIENQMVNSSSGVLCFSCFTKSVENTKNTLSNDQGGRQGARNSVQRNKIKSRRQVFRVERPLVFTGGQQDGLTAAQAPGAVAPLEGGFHAPFRRDLEGGIGAGVKWVAEQFEGHFLGQYIGRGYIQVLGAENAGLRRNIG